MFQSPLYNYEIKSYLTCLGENIDFKSENILLTSCNGRFMVGWLFWA